MGTPVRVQLVCQFGMPVRGLSPYGDALFQALEKIGDLQVTPVDYKSAYPSVLHPAEAGGLPGRGVLSWYSPASWRRVAQHPADILHIQHWAPPLASYLLPLAKMARRCNKRVAITVHNPNSHERTRAFKGIEDRFLRCADILLAHGEAGCRNLRDRLGAHSPAIRQIAHGMEVLDEPAVAAREDYERLGLDSARRYVLLFGNLRGYKGIEILLDAWRLGHAHLGGAELIIAGRIWSGGRSFLSRLSARMLGTSSDARLLKARFSATQRPGGVVLREGFQSNADIDALIRVSTFTVFPYVRFSGQSGAACRAASQGRPVLVSRVGSLPELAMDDSWMLVPGDREMLAQKLVSKLTESEEGQNAQRRQLDAIRRFDWSHVARAHASIYRELT